MAVSCLIKKNMIIKNSQILASKSRHRIANNLAKRPVSGFK